MKRTNKGFTIVELVVVIAVIAILAAVMIPTFSGVAGEAQEKADLANARAIYTEFIADHPEADIDYVKHADKYYAVSDFDVVDEEDVDENAVILEDGKWMGTENAPICTDGDDEGTNCDKCGAEKPTQGGNNG